LTTVKSQTPKFTVSTQFFTTNHAVLQKRTPNSSKRKHCNSSQLKAKTGKKNLNLFPHKTQFSNGTAREMQTKLKKPQKSSKLELLGREIQSHREMKSQYTAGIWHSVRAREKRRPRRSETKQEIKRKM
jgi:hypothetical protein